MDFLYKCWVGFACASQSQRWFGVTLAQIPCWGTDGKSPSLGKQPGGAAGLQSCSSSPSFPKVSEECLTVRWFWSLNVLLFFHVCLLLFIVNELVCGHGFKKLVVAKEGGCLPLVLDCRTGPCLFNDVTVFLPFILLSVLKRRAQRLLLYFLYPSGNISSPWFSTAIRNFSPTLVRAQASSKEKGRRVSFQPGETAEVMTEKNLILYTALYQNFIFFLAQLALNSNFLMCCANYREYSKDYYPAFTIIRGNLSVRQSGSCSLSCTYMPKTKTFQEKITSYIKLFQSLGSAYIQSYFSPLRKEVSTLAIC